MTRQIFIPFVSAFGGVERLAIALGRYLNSRGMAHQIVCFDDTLGLAAHAEWPLRVEVLRAHRQPFAEAWALRSHFAHAPGPLLFDLKGAFYAGLAALKDYSVHLTDPPSLLPRDTSKHALSLGGPFNLAAMRNEIVHRLNRRGVARASAVIGMTNAIAAEIRALYGVTAEVVRPGVARHPRTPLAGGEHLLSVCRLESSKRVDWILRAVASLPAAYRLAVVGDGPDRPRLEQLALELGIAERVQFHGRVDDTELERLYAGASLFLMPAVQGYGLPALESLARGVPVVVHAESGVSEILDGSPWARVIRGGVAELASAITEISGRRGELLHAPPPSIPDEVDWAAHICEICGWT